MESYPRFFPLFLVHAVKELIVNSDCGEGAERFAIVADCAEQGLESGVGKIRISVHGMYLIS